MTYRIRLEPSGREFEAQPGQTLLEAALAAGVNVHYNCNNGTCGGCVVKVLAGPLGAVEFHDYVIPEAERAAGATLLCRAHPGGDMTIEASTTLAAEEIPRQRLTARVARFERLDDGHRLLHLRTPRTHTLRFLAGQHVQLTLANGLDRDMAIASCPCNGLILQFHLRRDPDDPFLDFAFDRMRIGDAVEVDGPFGHFTLNDRSTRPLVFVARDTGFGPIKSLIEHAIALDLPQPMELIWLAGGPAGHYLANQVRAWADALDDFRFTPITLPGRELDETAREALLNTVTAPAESDYYISAKHNTREIAEHLLQAGALTERVKQDDTRERFAD